MSLGSFPDALFGRTYQVIIGTPRAPNQAVYGNLGGECSPLRVTFDVQKNAKGTPNKATIGITNMAPHNRNAIVPGMRVTLAVGYGDQLQTLFVGVVDIPKTARDPLGNVLKVGGAVSEQSGSDVVTKIECLDGAPALTQTRFSRAYDRGVTLAQVLQDLATAMQISTAANPLGMDAGIALGIPPVVYPQGLTVHGTVGRILRTLCKPQGLEWSIQNNALNIVPLQHHTGQQAEVLSPRTGLIGVPSWNGKLMQFNALLNPRLAPGRLVQIDSKDIQGFFKIRSGKWEGDSHGDKWQCELEGVELPHATQVLPSAPGFNYPADVAVG